MLWLRCEVGPQGGVGWLVRNRRRHMLLMMLCWNLLHVLSTCTLQAWLLLLLLLVSRTHVAMLSWGWLPGWRRSSNGAVCRCRNMCAVQRRRHGKPADALALRRAARVLPPRRRDHACCWCMVLPWGHCVLLLLLLCAVRWYSRSGCMWVTVRMWTMLRK